MFKIVIIDDEYHIINNLQNSIDWDGFHIEIALATTDPLLALDYVLTNPVDIVITDISMPVLDGLTLIKKIREKKPAVFTIVLSAYDNFEYVRTALRHNAENYLLKPIDTEELSDVISQIVKHIEEREVICQLYGRSLLTSRNTFTEQWLKNALTAQELTTRAQLLGINLNTFDFTVIIFSCPKNGELMMSKFFDAILECLPNFYSCHFYLESPLTLVGIFSPTSNYTGTISDFILPILQLASSNGIQVFASVGASQQHYSQVHLSYEQAQQYVFLKHSKLPYVFFQQNEQLVHAVDAALQKYTSTDNKDISVFDPLFQEYDSLALSQAILVSCVSKLPQNKNNGLETCPELYALLKDYPPVQTDKETLRDFIRCFLDESERLFNNLTPPLYPMVDFVINMIHENFDKELSMKTLAAKLNVSPAYLGTMFHQQTGYYFNDYLTEARMKHAAILLETTDLKIKDIVDKICFSSQAYFNRSFKKYYGVTPISYRNNKRIP